MTTPLSLSSGQVAQLEQVFRTTEDRRLRDRAQAVLMAGRGRSTSQIADDLATDPSTVRRWLGRWRHGGLDGLRIRWAPGKARAIDDASAEALVDWVRRGPAASGVDRANWTSEALAAHLGRTRGVRVAARTVRDFCARCGIRPYRPTYHFERGDARKQENARRELTVLKKRGRGRPVRAAEPR
ncbi:MAG TPA: helix-turn-helix domain-containing protein [Polyangiaceae bacterium]|nr:helix-turn-helix domain-containing protein [Polyangiaceae bacterium]